MQNKLTLLAILLLCGCGTTEHIDVNPTAIPTLNVNEQQPLTLSPVHFTIKVDNNSPQFCTDTKNYASLSVDLERTQNYLDVQKKQLDDSKHYYDNLNK